MHGILGRRTSQIAMFQGFCEYTAAWVARMGSRQRMAITKRAIIDVNSHVSIDLNSIILDGIMIV